MADTKNDDCVAPSFAHDDQQTQVDEPLGERSVGKEILNEEGAESKLAENELRLRTEELEALFRISGILAGPGSFEEKAAPVMEELARIAGGELAVFRVPDETQDGLRRVDAAPANAELFAPPVIPYGEILPPTIAFQQGRAVIVNDFHTHPLATQQGIVWGVRSMLSVPVNAGGTTLGVVTVSSLQADHFTPERVRLLTAIIDGLGTLLDNSRLARRLEASTEEIAAEDQVARIITSTLDLDEVYERFVEEVKKLVDFDNVSINTIDATKA